MGGVGGELAQELKLIFRLNTPGTAGGPGGHDRTLAEQTEKMPENLFFDIYLLVMPKYWGKQIFTLGTIG